MMTWVKRENKIAIVVKPAALTADKLLEAFAVDPETPLLVAVLAVLAGIEELAKESVSICELKDSERSFYAGGISKIAEAQGTIIDLVQKGNAAKRGNKEHGQTRTGTDGKMLSRFRRII